MGFGIFSQEIAPKERGEMGRGMYGKGNQETWAGVFGQPFLRAGMLKGTPRAGGDVH
jgi:hypothetical protein